MRVYKLTDANMRTWGGFQWTLGETRTASGDGGLCGPGWLHAYEDPLVAVFMAPAHVEGYTRLFEGEGEIRRRDGPLKCGCTSLRLDREIPMPALTTAQRVRAAILCAMAVRWKGDDRWRAWAQGWLDGKNRTAEAAAARAAAWEAAAEAAAWAAEAEEAEAEARARSAAWAAWAAAPLDLAAIIRQAIEEEPCASTT